MVFSENYSTATELNERLTRAVALGKADDLDHVNAADVQIHEIMVRADSFEYVMDLKDYWQTKSRWTTLVRQYIDPLALSVWLDHIEAQLKGGRRGQAFLRSKSVSKRGTDENTTRRWGSCMIGWGFRAAPTPTLTMHSRTTFLGYIAPLDLNVAHVIGRLVSERLGIQVEDMAFVWHLDSAQFHSSRSLGWWFTQEKDYLEMDRTKKAVTSRPGLASAIRQFNRYKKMDEEGIPYGGLKYASQLRPRKRWHTEVLGYDFAQQFEGGEFLNPSARKAYKPLPSVMADTLDFSPIKDPNEGDESNAESVIELSESE